MILHCINGEAFEISAGEIRDIRSSIRPGYVILILAHEFLPVQEAIGQIRLLQKNERKQL